jgi:putative transposase
MELYKCNLCKQPSYLKIFGMADYRRNRVEGGTYFFTLVTYDRKPIFSAQTARDILHEAWRFVCCKRPFKTDAICLLPDHIHCIWTLPDGDTDYSTRWKEIKRRFSHHYKDMLPELSVSRESMLKKLELPIWQRRFWEYTIRDETDLENHINYIHFNPAKHGYVHKPADWEWSTIHRYIELGFYDQNWGDQGENMPEKVLLRNNE